MGASVSAQRIIARVFLLLVAVVAGVALDMDRGMGKPQARGQKATNAFTLRIGSIGEHQRAIVHREIPPPACSSQYPRSFECPEWSASCRPPKPSCFA